MNIDWSRPVSLPRLIRAEGTALAAVAGIIALLFRDVVFNGQVSFERDIHLHFYPQSEAFARTVALGSWPVWKPYAGFGEPLLANPIMAVLYPFTWLNLLLQPWTQYTVVILFHAAWTAAGMLFLGRRLGLSTVAATVAAAIWITSGPMLSLVSVAHHSSGAAWLPWHVLAADTAVARRSTRSVIGWGAVIAAQVLTGSADQCVFSGLVVGAYVARRLEWQRATSPDNLRILLTALLSLALRLGALPRTYMVEAARVADGQPARERLVDPAFDPRQEVLLAEGVDTPGREGFEGNCLVAHWKPDRVRLRCTANRPAYAILVDTYDPGWRATVDGQATPLLRANTAFRAVAAPQGAHDIELFYRPAAVGLGVAMSTLAAGLALALTWWRRER